MLFVHAWRAAKAGDGKRLHEVAELAVASQTGFERRLEATAQGAAFRRIARASIEGFPEFLTEIDDEDLAYAVAAAALFAAQGIDLPPPGLIASFQKEGKLPDPLPPYRLELVDYLKGYSLWIAVVPLAVGYLYARLAILVLRRRRRRRRRVARN